MNNIYTLLDESPLRFLNHAKDHKIFGETNCALTSFAVDDAIATAVGNGTVPATMRIWVHPQTVVLGIPDSRLPYLEDGVHYVYNKGYKVLIRNSGGLAVALDSQVVNVSLIIPNENVSIHAGYDTMLHFIRELFRDATNKIKAFEIKGSYCPGDYDLSIHGIKFAGISQRRIRDGIAVQLYMDIAGSSYKRASLIKQFYKRSLQNEQTSFHYPDINPLVMGTISDLVNHPFTVEEIIDRIERFLRKHGTVANNAFSLEEERVFIKRLEQMKKRNNHITKLLGTKR